MNKVKNCDNRPYEALYKLKQGDMFEWKGSYYMNLTWNDGYNVVNLHTGRLEAFGDSGEVLVVKKAIIEKEG